LGVAALIDDMRAAKKEDRKIYSIVYFIYSKGAACRWENLLLNKIHTEAASRKKEDNDAYAELARALEIQGIGVPQEPEWVTNTRNRWHTLERRTKVLRGQPYLNAIREMEQIEKRFSIHGYEVNPKKMKED